MTISERYNLSDIVLRIETVLQIDGRDYGERDVAVIMDNIYKRMARQYSIELSDKKLTDEEREYTKVGARGEMMREELIWI